MTIELLPPDRYPHLELRQADVVEKRWKHGPPTISYPDRVAQGLELKHASDRVVDVVKAQHVPPGVDPALVLRVQTTGMVSQEEWLSAGLTVVASESKKYLILFTTDTEMDTFRSRVEAYEQGKGKRGRDLKNPDQAWLGLVDPASLGPITPDDRVGRKLRQLFSRGGLDPDIRYALDVELWYLGSREACDQRLAELDRFVGQHSGDVSDSLAVDGMCLARVHIPGRHVDQLLEIPSIAVVDLPPTLSHTVNEVVGASLDDFPPSDPPSFDAPRICVVDGGIARGHPLISGAVGETIAVPRTLGDGRDVNGHGTSVSGVALFFDVERRRQRTDFTQQFWLYGAQVTNEHNRFDDEKLIPTQMDEALRYFHRQGCRIFNLSLGDEDSPFAGGKPLVWAATLDNLAHELDVVIVVSAGNYYHGIEDGESPHNHLSAYPRYLLDEKASIIDPATAANALTVGALACDGVPSVQQRYGDVTPMPIAPSDWPSPFTRSGPGILGAIKPDLVEVGGNCSYDPRTGRVEWSDPGLSIVTLNWQYRQRLFTFDTGTSLAAPRVAHLAAHILREYPDASANLIRALLVQSARVPVSPDVLQMSTEEGWRLFGYGRPDLDRALTSTESRVVLIAEGEVPLDSFHVFEVPVPDDFRNTKGERRVSVTLAFDPPVRHRRAEYKGNSMGFRLIKNRSLDDIVRVFRATKKGEAKGRLETPSDNCELFPGPSVRDLGTVQTGTWTIKQNRVLEKSDGPLYLVVRSDRNWQVEGATQKYAVVVSFEHTMAMVRLYSSLRNRTRVSQRARVRG